MRPQKSRVRVCVCKHDLLACTKVKLRPTAMVMAALYSSSSSRSRVCRSRVLQCEQQSRAQSVEGRTYLPVLLAPFFWVGAQPG